MKYVYTVDARWSTAVNNDLADSINIFLVWLTVSKILRLTRPRK